MKFYNVLILCLWGTILLLWLGDIYFGFPADVSDEASSGIIHPTKEDINYAIYTRRKQSVLTLIPVLFIFGTGIFAFISRKNKLFYSISILTLIPILSIAILGFTVKSEMPCKNFLLAVICLVFGFVLLIGIKKLSKNSANM